MWHVSHTIELQAGRSSAADKSALSIPRCIESSRAAQTYNDIDLLRQLNDDQLHPPPTYEEQVRSCTTSTAARRAGNSPVSHSPSWRSGSLLINLRIIKLTETIDNAAFMVVASDCSTSSFFVYCLRALILRSQLSLAVHRWV